MVRAYPSTNTSSTMEMLPRDILMDIFVYTYEPYDLGISALVCKSWLQVSRDPTVIERCRNVNKLRLKFPIETNWESPAFLQARNRATLYPGLEKYLDFYHCLARAIRQQHVMAVRYFISKLPEDLIIHSELARLIDLVVTKWHPDIFKIIIKMYINLFPKYYNDDLFRSFPDDSYLSHLSGLPLPNPITNHSGYIIRKKLYELNPNLVITNYKEGLVYGYKEYLEDCRYNDFHPYEKQDFSWEICTMIYNLPQLI